MNRKYAGQKGEALATTLLRKSGYKILKRNFHTRFGEIDIIAVDSDTLVFIEVKARSSNKSGTPEEAITPNKLKSITKIGQYFKLKYTNLPEAERIDVVAIEFDDKGKVIRKELIKNVSQ